MADAVRFFGKLSAAALALLPVCAPAQTPSPEAVAILMDDAVRLFARVCLGAVPLQHEELLRALGFEPAPPPLTEALLRGGVATAWLLRRPPKPFAVVTSTSVPRCEVTSPLGDVVAAQRAFDGFMTEAGRSGQWVVTKVRSRTALPDGGTGTFTAYHFGSPQRANRGLHVAMSVRPSPPDGRIALLISLHLAGGVPDHGP